MNTCQALIVSFPHLEHFGRFGSSVVRHHKRGTACKRFSISFLTRADITARVRNLLSILMPPYQLDMNEAHTMAPSSGVDESVRKDHFSDNARSVSEGLGHPVAATASQVWNENKRNRTSPKNPANSDIRSHHSFGTRGSQVQILPLRPAFSLKIPPHRQAGRYSGHFCGCFGFGGRQPHPANDESKTHDVEGVKFFAEQGTRQHS